MTWPLGAHYVARGTAFAVFAPSATRVQLEFYSDAVGQDAYATFLPTKGPDGIWRAKIGGVGPGALYGYRVWGENWPFDKSWEPGSSAGFVSDLDEAGNRFNPNKVLFDPYAHEVSHSMYSDEIAQVGSYDWFGTGGADSDGVARRERDTARIAPKGIVVVDRTRMRARPKLNENSSSIYEVQVGELTGHPSAAQLEDILAGEPGFEKVRNIPDELRGTYKGAGMMAPYLKALGFDTVEFLPVHATNSSESDRPGRTNHWGYMTLSYFAPSRRFAADKSPGGPTREFKEMINAFHAAGIKVYLDVVYNHSAEGGNWNGDVNTVGFTSLGGFATAEYYDMTSDKILVDGATGTSNQLNYSSPVARQLVLDSLAHWADVMKVDGFRFDLATVLGREPDDASPDDWANQRKFFTDHPLLVGIAEWAESNGVEVIAEPWDLWGYEVGNFPRGWGEWNGSYRDAVRRFTKGDGNMLSFVDMLNGDYHHFADAGGPQKSINFVTAHDGFTMADLVSYQHKLNDQPWPFGPSDGGTDDNISWDSGGDHALRRQRLRNLWALLLVSRGTPMVVAGDEFGRTQNGNNNPWALDSVAMCNNYEMIATNEPQAVPVAPDLDASYHNNLGTFGCEPGVNALFRFATFMANLRRRHETLGQKAYGDLVADDQDDSYVFHTPRLDAPLRDGDRAVAVDIADPSARFWVMVNMYHHPVQFFLPQPREGTVWRRLVNTAVAAEPEHNFWSEGHGDIVVDEAVLEPWSVMIFHESPAPAPGTDWAVS